MLHASTRLAGKPSRNRKVDLTGIRYGTLTVRRRDPLSATKWECKCECGNRVYKNGPALAKLIPEFGCGFGCPLRTWRNR